MRNNGNCVRCGLRCQPGKRGDPKARPFQGAEKGLCADCAVTHLFLSPDFEMIRLGLLKHGLEVLRIPAIQNQFAEALIVGKSDLQIEDISWDRVIKQWNLPFPTGYRPHTHTKKRVGGG